MTGALDQLLGIDLADTECCQRLGSAALVGLGQPSGVGYRAHAASATPGYRLEHHAAMRVDPTLVCEKGFDLGQAGRCCSWQQRHAVLGGESARIGLVAEHRQLRRRWADEDQPGVRACLGEVGPLAEESVARVHRFAALLACHSDQRGDVEVSGRAGGLERHRFVGQAAVQRAGVVTGVDRDGGDPQVLGGADDADGDLTAVGNQQLLEHGYPAV